MEQEYIEYPTLDDFEALEAKRQREYQIVRDAEAIATLVQEQIAREDEKRASRRSHDLMERAFANL